MTSDKASSTILRILHIGALAVAVVALGVAALGWLAAHSLGAITAGSAGVLVGLVTGVLLGAILLMIAARRPASWPPWVVVGLHLCWIGIFGWYWFGRFGGGEIHSFDPREAEAEKARHVLTSAVVFLTWALVCSIRPIAAVLRPKRLGGNMD